MKNMTEEFIPSTKLEPIFPVPLYSTNRKLELSETEKKEIEDIISEGMDKNVLNSHSKNSYIFDTKLQEIKEFCKGHLNNYLEKVICPVKEKNIELYITQPWINVTEPMQGHHKHNHANSIISGVFYIQTLKNDFIALHDPNYFAKSFMYIIPETHHEYNTNVYQMPVKALDLILFPSWMEHEVRPTKTTENRVSLSFNTFIEGFVGQREELSEVVLD